MKKIQFALTLVLAIPISLASQSLATNILFEQANVVYKGRVERITYENSDAEGDDFGVSTVVEKVYKNNFYGEKIGLRVSKYYEIDTVSGLVSMNHQFQLKKDSAYVFFIQKAEEFKENGTFVYFANLADDQIEGIAFSDELEKDLESYDKESYLTTHDHGMIPFRILYQSSPVSTVAKVQKIVVKKGWYLIAAMTENGENILVKTKGLNCVCEKGTIAENGRYIFFLTPFEDGKYLLTDKWMGVIQAESIAKVILDYYKGLKAASDKVHNEK